MFKIIKTERPAYFHDFIIRNREIHNYSTRRADEFRTVYIHKQTTTKTIIDIGIILFNQLPVATRTSQNINTFKRLLAKNYNDF